MEKSEFMELVADALRDCPEVKAVLENDQGSIMVDLKDGSVFQINSRTVEEAF